MPYNPFSKSIGESLTADDLRELVLRKVTEGLYVEYKSDFRENDKMGQSVASFANSYGGWLFVGVEADKSQNVATNVCGVSLKNYPDPIAKIRDIAKSYISPVPAIWTQIVHLSGDMVVLVVYILDKQDKPFISSNGRIYRRNADASEPVFEKDRYTIDRLYEEGRDFSKEFEAFCNDERTYAEGDHQGWLKLFISPYPEIVDKFDVYGIDDSEKLLGRSLTSRPISYAYFRDGVVKINVPFNSCQTTHKSIILRQIKSGQLLFNSLELEFFINGCAKMFIPLPIRPNTAENFVGRFKSADVQSALTQIREMEGASNFTYLRFLDVGQLIAVVGALLEYYLEWLGVQPLISEFRSRILLDGLWRTVPFVDSDKWAIHVCKLGLPISTRDRIAIPANSKKGLTWDSTSGLSLFSQLSFFIGSALGLPEHLQPDSLLEYIQKTSSVAQE